MGNSYQSSLVMLIVDEGSFPLRLKKDPGLTLSSIMIEIEDWHKF